MGQVSSIWKPGGSAATSFIDFENARPTESEMKVFSQVGEVLALSGTVLKTIDDYQGCQDQVRKALTTPSQETERAAFEALLVVVGHIALFFDYAKKLEDTFPILLDRLSRPSVNESKDHKQLSLEQQQALTKQLADILDFSLRFDNLRMNRPSMSNDFSYYRRLLPKFHNNPNISVKDDDAGAMAIFTAEHIPMMTALCRAANKSIARNDKVTETLAQMSNSCLAILKAKKFSRPDLNLFIARAMTGSIVLFDHIDPLGAFVKRSPIQIRHCVLALKTNFSKDQYTVLLNALQYSTKTFKNAPSNVQELFD